MVVYGGWADPGLLFGVWECSRFLGPLVLSYGLELFWDVTYGKISTGACGSEEDTTQPGQRGQERLLGNPLLPGTAGLRFPQGVVLDFHDDLPFCKFLKL